MHKKYYIITCMTLLTSSLFTHHASAEEIAADNSIAGKALFESICAHCHSVTYDDSSIGAPGLQGVLERHDQVWLDHWLKSPETFAKNDETASDLIQSNRFGLAMPTLPAMQDDVQRAAMIDYLKTLK